MIVEEAFSQPTPLGHVSFETMLQTRLIAIHLVMSEFPSTEC